MQTQFPNLYEEVQAINEAYGWSGYLDALEWIRAHQYEFEGTVVLREFRQFVHSMSALFEPA